MSEEIIGRMATERRLYNALSSLYLLDRASAVKHLTPSFSSLGLDLGNAVCAYAWPFLSAQELQNLGQTMSNQELGRGRGRGRGRQQGSENEQTPRWKGRSSHYFCKRAGQRPLPKL